MLIGGPFFIIKKFIGVVSMSNIRDDLIRAFNNEEESIVPLSVWHHFTTNEHVQADNNQYFVNADISNESKFVESVDSDFVKLMNDGFFTYNLNNVENPNEISSLNKITEINNDNIWLTNQKKILEEQIKSIDSNKFKFSNVFSAITIFKWILIADQPDIDVEISNKKFADLYEKDPQVVIHALEVINKDIKKQIKLGHDAGVDGIFFSTQEIQDPRIDKSFFDEVQKRLDGELIDYINQKFDIGILHICGFAGAQNHLKYFVDYDLPVFNWATKFDGYSLSEGKKLFKNKVVLGGLGNTDEDVLVKGSKEDIQNEIDKLLDETGTAGVIIGADCTVPRDTPDNHIRWASQAAHTYNQRKGHSK